jgi:hypothetical protein
MARAWSPSAATGRPCWPAVGAIEAFMVHTADLRPLALPIWRRNAIVVWVIPADLHPSRTPVRLWLCRGGRSAD